MSSLPHVFTFKNQLSFIKSYAGLIFTQQQTRCLSHGVSKNRTERGSSSYKFVDRARVTVTAGRGGNGCLSYAVQMKSRFKKRPDGGHGGNGGYVILVADENEQSLNMQRHHFQAQDGKHGSSQQLHGRNGKDLIIRVPRGVVVKKIEYINNQEMHDPSFWQEEDLIVHPEPQASSNQQDSWTRAIQLGAFPSESNQEDRAELPLSNKQLSRRAQRRKRKLSAIPPDYDQIVNSGEKSADDGMYYWDPSVDSIQPSLQKDPNLKANGTSFDEQESQVIADLDQAGSFVIVAKGGKGGLGNSMYASRQYSELHPTQAAKKSAGSLGETTYLELELKMIADIGLVGFPNAGKSSLLAAMSMAKPTIAPYPFTTLHPLVGCIEYRDGYRVRVADIPGLIAGASSGRGRGFDFLRHLERTKALLYIVDSAGVDGRDPILDLKILFDEIASYGVRSMIQRPCLIVANKMDLISDYSKREELIFQLENAAMNAGVQCASRIIPISAGVTGEGLISLSKSIRRIVENDCQA